VGLRAGLDTEVRGKILCPCREPNPDRPVVQSDTYNMTNAITNGSRTVTLMVRTESRGRVVKSPPSYS
jgi:hypothetical protein